MLRADEVIDDAICCGTEALIGPSRHFVALQNLVAIGAVAQGSGACNGWTFWHIETNRGLRLIDELRAEIRSNMAAV